MMDYGSAKDSSSGSPPESSGHSGGSSSGSGSGVAQPCPLFSWLLVQNNTNDWTQHTDRHIELRIQASTNCGGSNDGVQEGAATSTVTVPAGMKMVFDWILKATVEAQDAGFDVGRYEVDAADVAVLGSQGNQEECVNVSLQQAGTTTLTAGVHTLQVSYDTVDEFYHSDASGVEFEITSCSIIPA